MMEWKQVESSQIHAVGYDLDTQTLGIQFKRTSKQLENKQPMSVYHYANVPPQLCADLINAESVGKFFGEHIKSNPTKYPYQKVEAA
jgi:hypothetical protein